MASGRGRVLLAEGDRRVAAYLFRELSREGYEVILPADGQEAAGLLGGLDAAASAEARTLPAGGEGFDILLAELREVRAGDLLGAVRRSGPTGPGVVVLTAFPSEETVLDCLREGASRVLAKPFSTAELIEAVEAAQQESLRVRDRAGDAMRAFRGFRGWVELTAPGRARHLSRLETFLSLLYGTALPWETKNALRTALCEIVANAMEWGSAAGQGTRVRVSYCYLPGEVILKVEDEGPGFDPDAVPDPRRSDPVAHLMRRAAEGKRGGGYGLCITRQLMDRVIYSERGNVVLLAKRLDG